MKAFYILPKRCYTWWWSSSFGRSSQKVSMCMLLLCIFRVEMCLSFTYPHHMHWNYLPKLFMKKKEYSKFTNIIFRQWLGSVRYILYKRNPLVRSSVTEFENFTFIFSDGTPRWPWSLLFGYNKGTFSLFRTHNRFYELLLSHHLFWISCKCQTIHPS